VLLFLYPVGTYGEHRVENPGVGTLGWRGWGRVTHGSLGVRYTLLTNKQSIHFDFPMNRPGFQDKPTLLFSLRPFSPAHPILIYFNVIIQNKRCRGLPVPHFTPFNHFSLSTHKSRFSLAYTPSKASCLLSFW